MQRGPRVDVDVPFVEDPVADANGLLSLRSTLAVSAIAFVLTALLALGPVGPFSIGGLLVAGPAGDATADPLGVEDEEDGLRVFVRGPRHLVPGYASRIEVRVTERGDLPALDGRRLQVTLDLDLEPEARGWVLATPDRVLVHPERLGDERFELRALGEVPCADEIGTLTVTATELVEDGRSVSAELTVPGASCDEDVVPEAPETVNELEAPTPRSSPGPAPAPPARSAPTPDEQREDDGPDETEPDDADEEEEADEAEPEPAQPAEPAEPADEADAEPADEAVEAPREAEAPAPDPEERSDSGSSDDADDASASSSGASGSGSSGDDADDANDADPADDGS